MSSLAACPLPLKIIIKPRKLFQCVSWGAPAPNALAQTSLPFQPPFPPPHPPSANPVLSLAVHGGHGFLWGGSRRRGRGPGGLRVVQVVVEAVGGG